MKNTLVVLFLLMAVSLSSFAQQKKTEKLEKEKEVSLPQQYREIVTGILSKIPDAASSKVNQMMDFAKSLLGTRYRYASSNPEKGFDCSGFVTYVLKQFGFSGARSSVDYAAKGKTVKLADAKVGDVLVFTGSNAKIRRPGHVGIIYSIDQDGNIKFIHSSSGKAKGVTITDLEGYYKTRLMKAVTVVE